MNSSIARTLFAFVIVAGAGVAQEVIPLYPGVPPGSSEESYPEKAYFSKVWNTQVVTNVTKPTLTMYKPDGPRNGNAVVICPGGGFMALSINSEGVEVAKWLTARGMTAFVLKYRLAHTGEDATEEFQTAYQDRAKFSERVGKVIPLSIADGLAALAYVRKHASDWGGSADRVGIVGFSAGGTVAAAAGLRYSPESRPAFIVPIYPAASALKDSPVPPDAPPLFLTAASDDQLGLAKDSVGLYEQWIAANKPAELHMYAKGGHGFGMRKQGFPSDHWIDRLGDWLESQGWIKK